MTHGADLRPWRLQRNYCGKFHQLLNVFNWLIFCQGPQVANEAEIERIESLSPFVGIEGIFRDFMEHEVDNIDSFHLRPAQLLSNWL